MLLFRKFYWSPSNFSLINQWNSLLNWYSDMFFTNSDLESKYVQRFLIWKSFKITSNSIYMDRDWILKLFIIDSLFWNTVREFFGYFVWKILYLKQIIVRKETSPIFLNLFYSINFIWNLDFFRFNLTQCECVDILQTSFY